MRLGMKHVLVSFCLSLAAVFAPTTPYLNAVDVVMRTANCIPSNSGRYNRSAAVHAVVVDMPQRASLRRRTLARDRGEWHFEGNRMVGPVARRRAETTLEGESRHWLRFLQRQPGACLYDG